MAILKERPTVSLENLLWSVGRFMANFHGQSLLFGWDSLISSFSLGELRISGVGKCSFILYYSYALHVGVDPTLFVNTAAVFHTCNI